MPNDRPDSVAAVVAAPPSAPFKAEDADGHFPWAGAALLLLLVVLAVAARWWSHRRGAGGLQALAWKGLRRPSPGERSGPELRIEASVRLDAQTQLHTVSWGTRRLLVATAGQAAPVVIERLDASEPGQAP